ncbi:MAG: helix-turn-helix domain-containing protein [Sphingorhabdus sp.]
MTPRAQYMAIISWVAQAHGLSLTSILSRNRTSPVAIARQDAFRVLCDTYGLSKASVSRLMRRDHKTVSYGLRRARERIAQTQISFDLGGGL